MRRLSTDSEGSDDGLDLIGLKSKPVSIETGGRNGTRGRTVSNIVPAATISRESAASSSKNPQSLRLSVKAPSSKLREVTTPSKSPSFVPLKSARDPFIGGEIVEGKRERKVRTLTTYDSEEDEDEDEEMDDLNDEDAEGESIDEDEDAEGDDDDDMDIDVPTPPVIKTTKAPPAKRIVTIKPPPKVVTKTVEQKDVEDDSDEELSELESDLGEGVEEEDAMQSDNDEDAEGEEVEEDGNPDDSDEFGSRASSPDLSKLTKRQRARIEEGGTGYLLALPDEVQVKKHFTAEEQAMRRAEMLRRRKNLSEKRNEEEKMETINKLLKRQAPKTNARRKDLNSSSNDSAAEPNAPKPGFVRWVSNKDGNRIVVPDEWIDAPIGAIFRTTVSNGMGGKLIEEVS